MAARRARREHADPFEDLKGLAARLSRQKRGLLVLALMLAILAAVGWFLWGKVSRERDAREADVARLEDYAEGNQDLMGAMARDLRAAEEMVRWGELLQTRGLEGFHLHAPDAVTGVPPGIGFFDPATGRVLLRLTGLDVASDRQLKLGAIQGEARRALGTIEPTDGVAVVYVEAGRDTEGFVVTDEPDLDVPGEHPPARDLLIGRVPGR